MVQAKPEAGRADQGSAAACRCRARYSCPVPWSGVASHALVFDVWMRWRFAIASERVAKVFEHLDAGPPRVREN